VRVSAHPRSSATAGDGGLRTGVLQARRLVGGRASWALTSVTASSTPILSAPADACRLLVPCLDRERRLLLGMVLSQVAQHKLRLARLLYHTSSVIVLPSAASRLSCTCI
jgi:hypothetical protein